MLCAECDTDLLTAYTTLLANESHSEASIAEACDALKSKVAELNQKVEGTQVAEASRPTVDLKRSIAEQQVKREREWTADELSMLAK